MRNLKYGTNEPIYETERDSWICVCQGKVGEGEGWTGRVGLVDPSCYIRMDKQDPNV